MKEILVTGGAGYIGWSIIHKLLELKDVKRIVIYDSLSRRNFNLFTSQLLNKGKTCQFVQGDILDQRSLSTALDGIDTVFHLAAKVDAPFRDIDSQYFEQVNHWGTSVLANEILKSKVQNIIYTSSVYVYGNGDTYKSENDSTNPNSFYGISKLRGEKQLQSILSDRRLLVLRIGNVFGYNPTMRFDVLINKLVFDAVHKRMVNIYGEGKQKRPFVQIDNLAEGIVRMANSQLESGTYNIADEHFSILDIVSRLREMIPDLEYRYINRNVRMDDILVEPNEYYLKITESKQYFTNKIKALIKHIS